MRLSLLRVAAIGVIALARVSSGAPADAQRQIFNTVGEMLHSYSIRPTIAEEGSRSRSLTPKQREKVAIGCQTFLEPYLSENEFGYYSNPPDSMGYWYVEACLMQNGESYPKFKFQCPNRASGSCNKPYGY